MLQPTQCSGLFYLLFMSLLFLNYSLLYLFTVAILSQSYSWFQTNRSVELLYRNTLQRYIRPGADAREAPHLPQWAILCDKGSTRKRNLLGYVLNLSWKHSQIRGSTFSYVNAE